MAPLCHARPTPTGGNRTSLWTSVSPPCRQRETPRADVDARCLGGAAALGPDSSVEEVTLSGEEHRDSGLACGVDDLFVAHRATGLHDRRDARVDEHLRAIGEGEERIGCGDRARCPVTGTLDGEPARVDTIDLAHADADRGV